MQLSSSNGELVSKPALGIHRPQFNDQRLVKVDVAQRQIRGILWSIVVCFQLDISGCVNLKEHFLRHKIAE